MSATATCILIRQFPKDPLIKAVHNSGTRLFKVIVVVLTYHAESAGVRVALKTDQKREFDMPYESSQETIKQPD